MYHIRRSVRNVNTWNVIYYLHKHEMEKKSTDIMLAELFRKRKVENGGDIAIFPSPENALYSS